MIGIPENNISQLFPQDNLLGTIIQIIWLVFFIAYMFYGQSLQIRIMLRDIEKSLFKLKTSRDKGRNTALEAIRKTGTQIQDLELRVDRILEHLYIPPVDVDPSGILNRLEHLMDVRDLRFKDEVKNMTSNATEAQINNLTNMLEAVQALNQIYKIVRHLYISGRKTSSFYIIFQLQMIMPQIMKESQAYAQALQAFILGQPIGDGIGPLVAANLIHGNKSLEMVKDIVVSELKIEGRTAYVLKAKGPGGNLGKPGQAVIKILEEKKRKISRIIIIDAAQKLEGEKPGEVVEGTGVAIGGIGVEKHKVEEIATKYKIPINAILVKESMEDVVSTMRKEISDSVEEVRTRIHRIICENTQANDQIIIAGIGNTIGISQ